MNLIRAAAGKVADGALYGATLYEIEPGGASTYHWHVGEEEFLLVVAGCPTLRTARAERELHQWDVVWFVRGEEGAHQVRNKTDAPVRVLIASTRSDPEVVAYPDDGKVGMIANWSRDDAETLRGWVSLQ